VGEVALTCFKNI